MNWLHCLCAILLGPLVPLFSLVDSLDENLEKGKAALEKNDPKSAISHFTAAVRNDRKDAEPYFWRAQAYYNNSEQERAYADLTTAIELNEKHADALFWRGRVGSVLGKNKEAVEDLTKSLKLKPMNAYALSARAFIRYEQAEYADSISDYKRATEVEPKWAEPWHWLAKVLAVCPESKCRDGAGAIRYAEKACELTKWKDFQALEALAAGYAEANKFEEAVKWQEKALAVMKSMSFVDIGMRAESRLKSYEMKKQVRIKSFVDNW